MALVSVVPKKPQDLPLHKIMLEELLEELAQHRDSTLLPPLIKDKDRLLKPALVSYNPRASMGCI